jgi:hypothetical protein
MSNLSNARPKNPAASISFAAINGTLKSPTSGTDIFNSPIVSPFLIGAWIGDL